MSTTSRDALRSKECLALNDRYVSHYIQRLRLCVHEYKCDKYFINSNFCTLSSLFMHHSVQWGKDISRIEDPGGEPCSRLYPSRLMPPLSPYRAKDRGGSMGRSMIAARCRCGCAFGSCRSSRINICPIICKRFSASSSPMTRANSIVRIGSNNFPNVTITRRPKRIPALPGTSGK